MVINKGPGRTDGLGTATVGGKEAIKHRRNTVEVLSPASYQSV